MSGALDRLPRFAGTWYPDRPEALSAMIARALEAAGPQTPAPARVVVAPHAGYRYSLSIAAAAYARVAVPANVILLCPNHTVPPPIVSVWPGGSWHTPLGAVPIAADLVARLRAECPFVVAETRAHLDEHAVELHLPILQHLRAGRPLSLVPVVVAAPGLDQLLALGDALARVVAERDDVLIVASTDMTHQESAAAARDKDLRALDAVLALDPARLLRTCEDDGISMCGVRPTTAALQAARRLGAVKGELARYGHSGEVTGDERRVVAYAAVVIR